MIPEGMYKKFRAWFAEKYGWWQILAVSQNDARIKSSEYFLNFLADEGLSPMGIRSLGIDPSQVAKYTERRVTQDISEAPIGVEPPRDFTQPPGFAWGNPWTKAGISEQEYATQFPREYQRWQLEQQAGEMGISYQDFMRHSMGLPTSQEQSLAEREFGAGETHRQWQRGQTEREQEAQMGLERTKMQQEADIWGLQAARGEASAFRQRMNVMGQPMYGEPTDWAQKAKQFEQLRQRALSSLGGSPDINWLQIEQERLKPNPFEEQAGREDTPQERLRAVQTQEKSVKNYLKDLEAQARNPNRALGWWSGEATQLRDEAERRLELIEDKKMALEAEMGGITPEAVSAFGKAQERDYSMGWMPPPEPKGVEVPKFLRQFVPGLTGKYIPGTGTMGGTAPQAITPSPQSWARTPLKQQRQFAGYTEFAGQDYEQLLRQMGQMIPQRPSLGRNWAAFGQRG